MEGREIIIEIRKILRALNLESKRIQKEHGVSIPQLLCLNFLKEKELYIATSGEIARALSLNASTTSGIIDRLIQKGLVVKTSSKEDKRVNLITLTAHGADILGKTPLLFHKILESKLKDLPGEELTQIADSLKTLTRLLEIGEVDASPIFTSEEPK